MNSYTKHNGEWVIKADAAGLAGQTVTVTTRAGAAKPVTLAQYLGPTQGGRFDGHLYAIAVTAPAAAETVGDLSRIVELFAKARQHLRYPAIVLDGFRVSVAGDRAKEPGSLTITSIERRTPRYGTLQRDWFGRVSLTGQFQPGRAAPADLGEKLRRFAADPAGEAAAYGHLHGACCFCNRALTDERSTAVGYGPICADHFGLEWGARAADEAAETLRDERNKRTARRAMTLDMVCDPLDRDHSMNG